MKINREIFVVIALLLVVPFVSKAEDRVAVYATSSVNATNTAPTLDDDRTATIREKMREDIRRKEDNIRKNKEIRNEIMEKRLATSSPVLNAQRVENRTERRAEFASTTVKNAIERQREIQVKQKEHLVDQLNKALANLKQVRERVQSRIEKTQESGRNMTAAKNSLVIADAKIKAAETAIQQFAAAKSFLETASSTTPISTTTIAAELSKAREAGSVAIKAVSEAKNALNKVVVDIAHAMGFKNGVSTTTPATATSTGNVSTSTSTASSTSSN